MDPERRFIGQLDPDAEGGDREGHRHHDEERRSVRGISERVIEATDVAPWGEFQEAFKKPALAALGTSTPNSNADDRLSRRCCLVALIGWLVVGAGWRRRCAPLL